MTESENWSHMSELPTAPWHEPWASWILSGLAISGHCETIISHLSGTRIPSERMEKRIGDWVNLWLNTSSPKQSDRCLKATYSVAFSWVDCFVFWCISCYRVLSHDDVIKWKHFPRYWPFVRGIHRGEFPTQRPVARSFDVFFDLRLNKRLSKQPWGWWFETLSRLLWRHRNVGSHWQWLRFGTGTDTGLGHTDVKCNIVHIVSPHIYFNNILPPGWGYTFKRVIFVIDEAE